MKRVTAYLQVASTLLKDGSDEAEARIRPRPCRPTGRSLGGSGLPFCKFGATDSAAPLALENLRRGTTIRAVSDASANSDPHTDLLFTMCRDQCHFDWSVSSELKLFGRSVVILSGGVGLHQTL